MICYPSPLEYARVVELIRQEKVSILVGTPVFLMGYLKKSQPGDFQSIWLVVSGADTTPPWLFEAFRESHQLSICEGYGTTETSPVISVNDPESRKEGSIGRPLSNLDVAIVDIESGEELPPGQDGRILVKGPSVMDGYFDDFEETSMRIKQGWYDTGDIGMIDEDGYLWHRGRLKRFVKIGGEMISLVRSEAVIVGHLPPESECCVVEVPDFKKGARLVAAMSGKEVDTEALQKACMRQLPPIAVPKTFIHFAELPKMGSGKIDFRRVTLMVKEHLSGG
jgi:acyl-[acyl-carrier-protein]-phospholipid O-acyltransferase/long-chain-fatty-acid--[acyl-carrier-protein] ligase